MISLNAHSLPIIKNRNELEKMYETSQACIREVIDKTHSRTLDKLYTDEFRPSKLHDNKTTIISLETGEPVSVGVTGRITNGTQDGSHRRKYFLKNDKEILGSKSFGIQLTDDGEKFTPGYIESFYNDSYSGTQIRLLQVACELAKKHGVDRMPLTALFPALKFHTMMGFRPIPERSLKMTDSKSLKQASEMFGIMYAHRKFYPEDVVPIFSKIDGDIYFDMNLTAFHAVMKDNERVLNNTNQRHLSLTGCLDDDISMSLEGEEFNKWQSRLKGFEILPEKEEVLKKESLLEKIMSTFGLSE